MIQLPNDVENAGYVRSKNNRFEWEQVFHSPAHKFTGTGREFIARGLAYEYKQLDKYRRLIINGND